MSSSSSHGNSSDSDSDAGGHAAALAAASAALLSSDSNDSSQSSDDGGGAGAASDSASAAPLSKTAQRKLAAKQRALEGQSAEHEAAQLVVLQQLLAEKSAKEGPRYKAPDLTTKDRKYRNDLEKKLRKELGWSRPDGTPWPKKLTKTEKAAQKAEKAAAQEAKARAKLAGYLAAGLLPPGMTELANTLAAKGRNPFKIETKTEDEAAAAAAATPAKPLAPLTPMELAWAKLQLKTERRALKAQVEEAKAKVRNRVKRKELAERYRLPREMHIPAELLAANPEANAIRMEKESRLYKYKRNAPNYQELVAKVREEFLKALPTAMGGTTGPMGAGRASGADGNVNSVHSGWDLRTKFVAEFKDAEAEEAAAAAAAAALKVKEEKPPTKKSKKNKEHDAAASTAVVAPPQPLLHESYQPLFISSFSWLPEQPELRKADMNPLDPSSLLTYTASRMKQPGAPYPYLRPPLPLVFRPNQKGVAVDKPDIIALIMAARVSGVTFEEPTASGAMADDEAEVEDDDEEAQRKKAKKMKKEKKRREQESKVKKETRQDADGDEAMDATAAGNAGAADSAPPAPTPLRFVSYRNNFRKFFMRKPEFWRVDLQKVGDTIYLRRHLNYNFVNPFDVGHLFEQACKEENVLKSMAEMNGVLAVTRYAAAGYAPISRPQLKDFHHKEDSTTHPYRAIVQAKLREFEFITSIEIDLCQKAPSAASSSSSSATPAASASASSSAAAASSSSSSHRIAAPAALTSAVSATSSTIDPSNPLSTFLELKTVPKHRWTGQKKTDVWVQTFLGGIQKTIVGFKEDYKELDEKAKKKLRKEERRVALQNNQEYAYDSLKKRKLSKRAGQSAALQIATNGPPAVQVSDIIEARTEHLLDASAKEKLMQRFYSMCSFLAKHVKAGRVYKLEHRKKSEAKKAAEQQGLKPEEAAAVATPYVHPSRLAAVAAASSEADKAAPAGPRVQPPPHDDAHVNPSHAENWEIILEEIEGGMATQPVILPGVLSQVDAWAEVFKVQQAQERAQKEAEEAAKAAEEAAEKERKKSKKKKKSSSKDKEKKKSSKKKKHSSKRKEREGDESATSGGAHSGTESESGSTSKKKKEKKKSHKKSRKDASAAEGDSTAAPAAAAGGTENGEKHSNKKKSKSEKKAKKSKSEKKHGKKRKEPEADATAAPAATATSSAASKKATAAAASDSSSDSDSN